MTQSLRKILNHNANLRSTLAQAQTLMDLQKLYATTVPAYLAEVTTVISLNGGIMKLAVYNQTIAAKLKQMTPELIEKLRKRGCEVSGISIKVQVSLQNQSPKPQRHLGPEAKKALGELDNALADSPLKQAIKKLRGST